MSDICTPSGFLALAERHAGGPESHAISEAGRTYTYSELVGAARRWRDILEPIVQEGEVVAVDFVPDAFSHLSILLAVMAAGGVHVSVRKQEHAWQRLERLGAPWHVITSELPEEVPSSTCTVIDLHTGEVKYDGRTAEAASENEAVRGRILETSGSSGEPKWVYWTENDLVSDRQSWVASTGLTSSDVIFNMHPLDFGHGVDVHALPALCAGASLVHDGGVFDPVGLTKQIIQSRATYMSALPSHYEAIAVNARDGIRFDSHLRMALTGGALLSQGTAEVLNNRFGIALRRIYGATEAGIMCADLGDYVQLLPKLRPMEGVDMMLKPLQGIDVLAHRVAQPFFRRNNMFSHYWGDPVRTEQALDHGWYASGDAVRVSDDGSVAVLGRADDVWTDRSGALRSASELLDAFSRILEVEEVVVFSPNNNSRNRPTVLCRLTSSASGMENAKEESSDLTGRLDLDIDVYFVSDWPKTPVGKPNRQVLLAWAAAG